jgi:hypothetical protein
LGSIWLRDLPAILSGLNPEFYSGWENRSRSSGGYDGLVGIAIHHTASNTSAEKDMQYMWSNASDRPIGAIYRGRDGRIVVGCAGATNTQGKGGPLYTTRGYCPQDKGNQYLLAIEAANAGTGEPWPQVQTDRFVALVRALCDGYWFSPADVFGHYDYCAPSCPGRKIDPAGPSPFGTVNASGTWDINAFRAAVAVTQPPPTPTPVPIPSEVYDMLHVIAPGRGATLVGPGFRHFATDDDEPIVFERAYGPPVQLSDYDYDKLVEAVFVNHPPL